MKTIFLNMKTSQGIETVDSFEMGKEENRKAFTKYVNDIAREYRVAGMNVYQSPKCTKEWRNK